MARRNQSIAPGGVAAQLAGTKDPRKAVREDQPPPEDGWTDADDLIAKTMVVRSLNPRKGKPNGKIRWYHRVKNRRCHAFTMPKKNHEDFRAGDSLSARGVVYPDGKPVVPDGHEPYEFHLRCGTCGTSSVEFLQLLFFSE